MKFSEAKNHLNTEGAYFKFKDGENRLRIVTEPVLVWKSFNKEEKTAKVYMTETAGKQDKDAKKRFMMYVINRENEQIQIGEFGPSIVSQLTDLQQTNDYKFDDLPPYDISIRKTGAGLDTEYKVVAARANSDLTEEEKIKVFDLEPLESVLTREAIEIV